MTEVESGITASVLQHESTVPEVAYIRSVTSDADWATSIDSARGDVTTSVDDCGAVKFNPFRDIQSVTDSYVSANIIAYGSAKSYSR